MKHSLCLLFWFIVAFLSGYVAFSEGIRSPNPFYISMAFIIGFFGPFAIVLYSNWDKIFKGFTIIGLGTWWAFGVPHLFAENIHDNLSTVMEVFKNIIAFASSGAGGGIIAADAEHRHKAENPNIEKTVIDKTKKIDALIDSVERLQKTAVRIHLFYGFMIFIGFLLFVTY